METKKYNFSLFSLRKKMFFCTNKYNTLILSLSIELKSIQKSFSFVFLCSLTQYFLFYEDAQNTKKPF